jgi:hypothetical protein
MKKTKFRLTNPFRFLIERQFVKGAKYQLLAVVALIGLISLFGGILAFYIGGPGWGFGESVWWAFLRLTDTGYLGDDEGTLRRIVSTFLTVSGSVVFLGALVAIMTQWLNSKMEELEQGLTPVAVKNHIVILGWTNRTHPIVVEFFESVGKIKRFLATFGARKLRLVILAENSSAQLTRNLKTDQLIGKRADEIIFRTGDPLKMEHLLRVDCYNASAIIIPSQNSKFQDLVSADVETIKTLLSLSNNPKIKDKSHLPYVVAEIQDEKKLTVARRAYPGPLEIISGDSIISRLIAQNVRHVGLSDVYEALLSRGNTSDLYIREHSSLEGESVGEIRHLFPNAIVMGLIRVEETKFIPMLNRPDDTIINESDRIVLLANTYHDTEVVRESKKLSNHKTSPKPIKTKTSLNTPVKTRKRLLILGWNNRLPALISEFGSYEDREIQVTMVSVLAAKDRKKMVYHHGGFTANVESDYVEADYMVEAELRKIDPGSYDHIILLSSSILEDTQEADARTIVGKVLLEEILEGSDRRPQILIELADPANSTLVGGSGTEMIVSPIILSHLLAQVALRRELQTIYTELFTVGGAEIEFRNPDRYGMETGNYTFLEIAGIASDFGETALGICKNKKNSELKNKLILNPPKNDHITITEKDELVVLMTY